jgi:hypothetical protein
MKHKKAVKARKTRKPRKARTQRKPQPYTGGGNICSTIARLNRRPPGYVPGESW